MAACLLARVFRIDVSECPHCGGRMKIIAALTEPAAIRAYLDGVCLDSRPRPASTPYPAYLNTPQSAGLSVR
ncbi:MAG: hypothetical protein CME19_11475 [Gemmatimonadetes bacterium]|nr:hypothetical protein [Gemmatimonadota bacterium]